jgi:hypothetical protein
MTYQSLCEPAYGTGCHELSRAEGPRGHSTVLQNLGTGDELDAITKSKQA